MGRKLLIGIGLLALAWNTGAGDFDALRLRWRDFLTQGTNASRAHPLYSNWVAEVESTGQSYLNALDTSPGRTNLFSNYSNLATDSSDITTTYEHLRAMAQAYTVAGSALQGNSALLTNIISGLNWMHARYYNSTVTVYDNWYDFEIAIPRALNDITVLLYSNLTPAEISNYMGAIDHFSPTPDFTSISSPVMGYNKVWKALVVSLRGVIVQDSAKVALGRDALSDVFANVTSGEGFYADGSFIFHDEYAYNTGYGVGLLDTLGSLLQLLDGSAWAVTDPARTNVFRWVYDAYAPFIVRGSAMELTSGRYPTRNGDNHARGHELLGAILRVAQVAPPADAAAIQSFVKSVILSDTSLDFLNTQFPPYNVWADAVLRDTNVAPRAAVTEHRQFPSMDRVVHHTPEWTFGLAMSSKRIANYESTRGENLHGWFTGEGMTYLYNSDLTQYAENFWATVDPYRLAGTTVDTISRTNGSGAGYNSPNTQVGGASILGRYGVAAMHLNAYGTGTMSARNSWFLFDDEIVCVGNSISSAYGRETIIDNRRLGVYGRNPFTVNGLAKPNNPGWSETLTNVSWAHLAGSTPGSDLGWFLPAATTVNALRESRSGKFYDVNTTYGSMTPSTANYLTLVLDHGSNATSATYAYVLLPGRSADAVAAYAANPDILIAQNNSKATAVRELRQAITAVNFWSDTSNNVSGISCDRKAAVILRNDGNVLDLGMSDPTQTNTSGLRVEVSTPALSILSTDPGITVAQLSPTVKLLVNTSNRFGATLGAKFLVQASGQRPAVTLSTPDDANRDAPATVTLKADASDPDGAIARLDFYNGATRIAQVFAPASNSVTLTVSNLAPGSFQFTAVAVDDRGLLATSGPVTISVWTAEAAGRGTGLIGDYFKDQGEFRVFSFSRVDAGVNFYWAGPEQHPIPHSDHFCIRWTGKLQARRSGLHWFQPDTDEGVRLWVDGRLVVNHWEPHTETEDKGSISLVAGRYYPIAMEYYDEAGVAVARLYWTQPGGVKELIPQSQLYPADQGLFATYFATTNMTPNFAEWVRVDDTVNFNWGTNSPEPTLLSTPFAARWTGKLKANAAGQYTFFTSSDDAVRLFVNGQFVINNWTPHPLTENSNVLTLSTAGQLYDLTLEYFNASGPATIVLSWQPPGESKQIIPASNLTPHQNNSPPVLAPIGDATTDGSAPVTFTATAADPDGATQSLTFSLDAGAPPGATLQPTNGLFQWIPANSQPGGRYSFTARVTDSGNPVMSDSQSFTITLVNADSPCPGLKGDVAPRPGGNGMITVADWVQVGRFAAGVTDITNACEFAMADCAPKPCGDGSVTIADWVQVGRYAAGLDNLMAMSNCPATGGFVPASQRSVNGALLPASPRRLSIPTATIEQGRTNCIPILLDALGGENALGFSFSFDPKWLSFVSVTRGEFPGGAQFHVNATTAGRIGVALALPAGESFKSGRSIVARVCFGAAALSRPASSALTLGDQPIRREIVDVESLVLPAACSNGAAIVTCGDAFLFEAIRLEPTGRVNLRLIGQSGVVWNIQASPDLDRWQTIGMLTNATGLVEYTAGPASGHQFYRASRP